MMCKHPKEEIIFHECDETLSLMDVMRQDLITRHSARQCAERLTTLMGMLSEQGGGRQFCRSMAALLCMG